ncbi:large subunit ribosomal protein L7A [Cytobacillus kochii]|nr:large subunit ribosomal protein L7A [Cytobacillus kochii]
MTSFSIGGNIAKVLLLLDTLEDEFMSYEKVLQAKEIIVGTKQTVKALKSGIVSEVVIASDTNFQVKSMIEEAAKDHNVPITYVDSMKKLGKACGIDVGAAAVALTI